jgi:hypothetical protein
MKKNKLLSSLVFASMIGGLGGPFGFDEYTPKRRPAAPKEPSDPHQDSGVCSKPVRRGAGKRMSRAERKRKYGSQQNKKGNK